MAGNAQEWNQFNLMQQISPTGKLEKDLGDTVEITELPEAWGSPWRDKTVAEATAEFPCYVPAGTTFSFNKDGEQLEAAEVHDKLCAERRVPRFDDVERPQHYGLGKVECIEAIEASMSHEEYLGYLKGSALKYLWRYRYKGKPLQDLNKAQWYLNKLKEEHK